WNASGCNHFAIASTVSTLRGPGANPPYGTVRMQSFATAGMVCVIGDVRRNSAFHFAEELAPEPPYSFRTMQSGRASTTASQVASVQLRFRLAKMFSP